MKKTSVIQNWTKKLSLRKASLSAVMLMLALTTVFYSCKKDPVPVPVVPAPTISSFTPATGGANTDVTVTGLDFPTTVAVTVNGKAAVVKSSTATTIVLTLQPGTGSGLIIVTGSTGTATSATAFSYNFITTATTVAGATFGSIPAGDNTDNGAFLSAKIGFTGGSTFDKNGNLLYTEIRGVATGTDGTRIRRLNFTTKQVETFATTSLVNGGSGGFGFTDVAVASDGTVFAVNQDFNSVYKFPATGGVNTATLFAGKGVYDKAAVSADGTGTGASFVTPSRITIDENNNLYVVENANSAASKVRKITPAGVVTTIVATDALVDIDGKKVSPLGIKYHAGSLYVTNFPDGWMGSGHIFKMGLDGSGITRFAGGSVSPSANKDASRFNPGTSKDNAIFWYVTSIDFDASGNMYATDGFLGMVYRIDAVTNKVTNAGGAWTADNNAKQAAKYGPLLGAGLVLTPEDPSQQPFRSLSSINISSDGSIFLTAGSDDNTGAQKIYSISSK
jgi:hypothetical protein